MSIAKVEGVDTTRGVQDGRRRQNLKNARRRLEPVSKLERGAL